MYEIQVEVVRLQIFELFSAGLRNPVRGMVTVVELGGKPDLVSGYIRVQDALANSPLALVHSGCVYVPMTKGKILMKLWFGVCALKGRLHRNE